jgi:hypothetical protein
MKIIQWIKENIFNIKPIFKIQIKNSWFSDSYKYIRFSNNNGHKWYVIISKENDIDENRYTKYKIDTKYIHFDNVESFIKYNDLNSFENCIKYNEIILNEIDKDNFNNYTNYTNKFKEVQKYINDFNNGK